MRALCFVFSGGVFGFLFFCFLGVALARFLFSLPASPCPGRPIFAVPGTEGRSILAMDTSLTTCRAHQLAVVVSCCIASICGAFGWVFVSMEIFMNDPRILFFFFRRRVYFSEILSLPRGWKPLSHASGSRVVHDNFQILFLCVWAVKNCFPAYRRRSCPATRASLCIVILTTVAAACAPSPVLQ